jgi:hypothetical protein
VPVETRIGRDGKKATDANASVAGHIVFQEKPLSPSAADQLAAAEPLRT